MAFLLRCPDCGERSAYDFTYGGEVLVRPSTQDGADAWTRYFYHRKNLAAPQREWWYHKFGCRRWFFAERDTRNNRVERTYWPEISRNEA